MFVVVVVVVVAATAVFPCIYPQHVATKESKPAWENVNNRSGIDV